MKELFAGNEYVETFFTKKAYVQSLLSKLYHQEFKDSHLTRESGMLLYLIKNTDLTQKDIAHHLHITQATLSGRIKRLERDGYLKKIRDSQDHRKYKLAVNEEIGKEIDDVMSRIIEINKQITVGLSFADYDELNHILDIVEKNIKKMLKE